MATAAGGALGLVPGVQPGLSGVAGFGRVGTLAPVSGATGAAKYGPLGPVPNATGLIGVALTGLQYGIAQTRVALAPQTPLSLALAAGPQLGGAPAPGTTPLYPSAASIEALVSQGFPPPPGQAGSSADLLAVQVGKASASSVAAEQEARAALVGAAKTLAGQLLQGIGPTIPGLGGLVPTGGNKLAGSAKQGPTVPSLPPPGTPPVPDIVDPILPSGNSTIDVSQLRRRRTSVSTKAKDP